MRQIIAEREWPRVLDLPTGSGKTTCIDIALFALALDAASDSIERWCPRRIAMIVDRRVVVDQAAARGRKLLAALTSSSDAIVVKVREALAALSEENEPLGVFTLRGGIPKDDGWARTPDQPLVIASTVDQLGSRLLIQGYGVSPGMRPVHAGLAGNDMLILLDEVHLSQPFKQTLERLRTLRERFRKKGLPRRFQFAFLSATPGETKEQKFELTRAELEPSSALGPRLHAKKTAHIVEVSGRDKVAEQVASEASELIKRHHVVAAVVNRVDTALTVFATLRKGLDEEADVLLLTGRMRPLDRDDVLAAFRARIMTGARIRTAEEARLVVVGTQCIEAGADFDFDAMVTESASFDGLRQRFGRVDRLGEYKNGEGSGKAEGVIVHDKDEKDDPIYQQTISETVKWLKAKLDKKRKTVDFGSRSLLDAPAGLLAPKENAPTLLPAYLDLWSQTAPEPSAVPEPGLFLHGPRSGPEDVQVIWRADLDEAAFESQTLSNLVAAVAAVRPSSLEAISLPFVTARRWLAQTTGVLAGAADLEGRGEAKDNKDPSLDARRALRWRGDKSEIVDVSKVRPGDTLIVPSSYGGIAPASRCFDPSAEEEVPDLAERASLMARGRPLLRVHPRVLAGLELTVDRDDPEAARSELAVLAAGMVGWKRGWAGWLGAGRIARTVPCGDGGGEGWVVLSGERVNSKRVRDALDVEERDRASIENGVESTTDDEDSPYVGSEVELDVHSRDVEERARDYATRLWLSDELARDLALAAWLHDIGKADRRFQRMLRGGSEIAYYRDEGRILAKSGMAAGSRAEHRKAQQQSGYPPGARHEVQSLAMIEAAREQVAKKAHDLDLVMHLVASHHGHCRPFAPAIEDLEPVDVSLDTHASETLGTFTFTPSTSANGLHRLDSSLADRFWLLVATYGWLELCWLEAILRLADHRASEDESGG
ncbi:MAG: type I-G CRISPR-associated helicase/endonuclease Cas3g [Steroidobacteraceae bacterium]